MLVRTVALDVRDHGRGLSWVGRVNRRVLVDDLDMNALAFQLFDQRLVLLGIRATL